MEITQNNQQGSQNTQQNNKKKAGLGRGLGSLLGEIESVKQGGELPTPIATTPPAAEIIDNKNRVLLADVTQLKGNPNQPRRNFDPDKLRELSNSIKEKGIIQPILVRETEEKNHYEIIAGER